MLTAGSQLGPYETLSQLAASGTDSLGRWNEDNRLLNLLSTPRAADGRPLLVGTRNGESKTKPPSVILDCTADLKK